MKIKSVEKLAEELANEISERKIFDIDDVKQLISIRFRSGLFDFLSELSSVEEKEYLIALDQQSRNKIGSTQYIALGYKLSALKAKKASVNRAINNVKRDDKLERLKKFVNDKFGELAVTEFETKEMELV